MDDVQYRINPDRDGFIAEVDGYLCTITRHNQGWEFNINAASGRHFGNGLMSTAAEADEAMRSMLRDNKAIFDKLQARSTNQ